MPESNRPMHRLIAQLDPTLAEIVQRDDLESPARGIERARELTRLNRPLMSVVLSSSAEHPDGAVREAFIQGAVFMARTLLRQDGFPELEKVFEETDVSTSAAPQLT